MSRLAPDELVRSWEHELTTTGRTRVAASRGRTAWLVVGAIAFVAAGAWMLGVGATDLGVRIVGVVGVLFFGACLVALAVRLVRPEVLIVTRSGLSSGRTELSWRDVSVVGMYVLHRNRIVVLVLSPAAAAAQRERPARLRWATTLTGVLREPHVAFRGPYADVPTLVTWLESLRRGAP